MCVEIMAPDKSMFCVGLYPLLFQFSGEHVFLACPSVRPFVRPSLSEDYFANYSPETLTHSLHAGYFFKLLLWSADFFQN